MYQEIDNMWSTALCTCIFVAVVYLMVMAACKDHNVSTHIIIYHGGAWLQFDNILCPCGAT